MPTSQLDRFNRAVMLMPLLSLPETVVIMALIYLTNGETKAITIPEIMNRAGLRGQAATRAINSLEQRGVIKCPSRGIKGQANVYQVFPEAQK